jgi:hypothetical protein
MDVVLSDTRQPYIDSVDGLIPREYVPAKIHRHVRAAGSHQIGTRLFLVDMNVPFEGSPLIR